MTCYMQSMKYDENTTTEPTVPETYVHNVEPLFYDMAN